MDKPIGMLLFSVSCDSSYLAFCNKCAESCKPHWERVGSLNGRSWAIYKEHLGVYRQKCCWTGCGNYLGGISQGIDLFTRTSAYDLGLPLPEEIMEEVCP